MSQLLRDLAGTIGMLLLVGQCGIAGAAEPSICSVAKSAEAVGTLRAKIRAEKLYAAWAKEQCLSFYAESCDSVKVDIAISEIHSEVCGGDPQTGPVLDRFRVYRKSQRIEWYNVIDDEYLDFEKVHSIGGR